MAREDWAADAVSLESLQPQDLVISLIGTYVHGRQAAVWSGGLVGLLSDFGFSVGASRAALSRLARRGLLERVKRGRIVHYRPTPRLVRALDEGQSRIFTFGRSRPRGDRWTIVWHSIPEDMRVARGLLASRLRFFGFGSIQYGTWVSPHDREEEVVAVVRDLDVERYTAVFVGAPSAAFDLAPMIVRAWDMEGLANRYRAFVAEYGPYQQAAARRRLDDRSAFVARTRLIHTWRGFPLLDPELPDSLTPQPQLRPAASRVFHRVYDALEEPSLRHFRAVTATHD